MDVRPTLGPPDCVPGESELGALLRTRDWSCSPLGPSELWPDALRMAVSLCLQSSFPILIYWGPDLALIYNDAFQPFVGPGRHPAILGQRGREVWADMWDTIGPQVEGAMRGDTTGWLQDLRLFLDRHGYREEAFFTHSHSPIRDADGRIGGVFCIIHETTERMLNERRLDLLRRLGEATAVEPGIVGACRAADAILAGQPDTVFSLTFLAREDGVAQLVSAPFGHVPAQVPLDGDDPWRIAETIRSGRMTILNDLEALLGEVPCGPWPGPPAQAAVLPIARQDQVGSAAGALIIGLNPHRRLDVAYEGFLTLVAGHLATTICAHRARERAAKTDRIHNDELLAVLETVPTAVLFTRDKEAAVSWLNDQAADLLRLPCSGIHRLTAPMLAQMGITILRDGRPIPQDMLPLRRAAHGEEVPGEEQELRFRDGTSHHVIVRARPLRDPQGGISGAVMAVVDITASKLAEAAMQRSNAALESRVADRTAELEAMVEELRAEIEERERMEATLRQMQRLEAVGQLTAGIAHDFNNLLTVILGHVEFLERDATGPVRRRLATVRGAAERGARLTGQLLAFARRQQLQPRAVDLNAVIAGMRDLLRTTTGGTIEVRTALYPALWPAMVDPTQIELVILNLALNARDAMPRGGTLTIATSNARLGPPELPEQPEAGQYVTLRISDTGVGMSEEVLAHAFEPFFTTKPAGQGSGLGLAQVYGFAQQSGGGVEIESRPGRGTTVRVYLPRATEAPPEREECSPALKDKARARILLVEDEAPVRELTAAMLEDAGYIVTKVDGAAAALAMMDGGEVFDLLVADVGLPGMTGGHLAHAARQRQPDLPILFITGYADSALLADLESASVLLKPFCSEDLVRRLRELEARSRVRELAQ
jgi:signal transduction histidine kinase/CheY-like chemotaxis protein